MTRFRKRSTIVVCAALAAFATSCKDPSLTNLSNYESSVGKAYTKSLATANLNFCTTPGTQLKSLVKFVFLVDHSGSNFQDYDGQGNPLAGTDPMGKRRFSPLISFIGNLPTDSSGGNVYYFDLIDFSDHANDVTGGFINGAGNFTNVLLSERDALGPYQPKDGGWTNYIEAEGLAYGNILNDINAAKASGNRTSTAYIIFHITDGQPIVNQIVQDRNAILGGIASIEALQPANKDFVDTIQYNDAYYYNTQDPAAVQLLQAMAAAGGGKYYEFSAGQAINYQSFALPSRQIRHLFEDIYVENLNTAWDKTPSLVLSSAGDGVPDALKPDVVTALDEDQNGVSDLAELRASNEVCLDSKCAADSAATYELKCAAYLTAANAVGLNRFITLFQGGLNQCEAFILGGDVLSWHSTLAPIPDSLLERVGLSMAVGSNSANLDPFSENMPNYLKIKLNAPVNFAKADVPDLVLQSYHVAQTSTNALQDCYSVQVNNISTILTDANGNSVPNKVGVWEVETDAIIGNSYYLRYGVLPISSNGTVTFGNGDLK